MGGALNLNQAYDKSLLVILLIHGYTIGWKQRFVILVTDRITLAHRHLVLKYFSFYKRIPPVLLLL